VDKNSDLEKLSELRDSGVISAREFKQKQRAILAGNKPKSRWRGWWWKLPLALIGLVVFLNAYDKAGTNNSGTPVARMLPACDSVEAKKALINAVEHNASSGINTLHLLDWKNARAIGGQSDTISFRLCAAILYLNSGEESVKYKLFFPNSDADQWLVQITDASD
jgi:hypothetical protein